MLRVFQSDWLPSLAAVGRLIDAVAVRNIAAQTGLSGANVDDIRIRLGNRDGADRRDHRLVGEGLPGHAAVGGAPHASGNTAEIVGEGIAWYTGYREHAASAIRADGTPL